MEVQTRTSMPSFIFQEHAVHQAMAFVQDCHAYMQAVATCPQLIERDSSLHQYFYYCNYNVWQAARRVALYWQLRVEIFGPVDAFKPLSKALTRHDKALLREGVDVVLPVDKLGRQVALVDRSRLQDHYASAFTAIKRGNFYCVSEFLRESFTPPADLKEIVGIIVLSTKMRGSLSVDLFQLTRRLLTQGIAARFCEIHLIAIERGLGLRTLVETIAPVMGQWFGGVCGVEKVILHAGTLAQVQDSLSAQSKLDLDCLPESCGGKWSYETDWMDWLHNHGCEFDDSPAEGVTVQRRSTEESAAAAAASPNRRLKGFDLEPVALPEGQQRFRGNPVHSAMLETATCYWTAVEQCPQVVETETPHEMYLQFCHGDPRAAARRLANYWSLREQVLGAQEAYRPVTLEQDGARVVLPQRKANDISVLLLNSSMISKEPTESRRSRANWLFLHVASFASKTKRQPTNRRAADAVEVITLLDTATVASGVPLGRVFCPVTQRAFADMCLRLEHMHYVALVDDKRPEKFVTTAVAVSAQRGPDWLLNLPTTFHLGRDLATIASSLEREGFSRTMLPGCCGGNWDSSAWIDDLDLVTGGAPKSLPVQEGATKRGSLTKKDFDVKQPIVNNDLKSVEAAAAAHSVTLHQRAYPGEDGKPDAEVTSPGTRATQHPDIDYATGNPVHQAMAWTNGKGAYELAIRNCPDLVRSETPYARFLFVAGMDPYDAAQRLADYWSIRLEVFGFDEAFQPIARMMKQADVDCLMTCHGAVLPDSRNRKVFYFDRTRMPEDMTTEQRMRAYWFIFHFVGCDLSHQWKTGISDSKLLGLAVFHASDLLPRHFDAAACNLVWRMAVHAMNGRVEHMHYVLVEANGSVAFLTRAVLALTSSVSKWLASVPSTVHSGTPTEILISLENHGFSKESLPQGRCGGQWPLESGYTAWLEKHVALAKSTSSESGGNHTDDVDVEVPAVKGQKCATLPYTTTKLCNSTQTRLPEVKPARRGDSDPRTAAAAASQKNSSLKCASSNCRSLSPSIESEFNRAMDTATGNKAYKTAVSRCPKVVATESPVSRFLEESAADPNVAAQRLADYWSVRVDVLNEDAFLPLTEAIKSQDLSILMQGFEATLPRGDCVGEVVLHDRTKLRKNLPQGQLLRAKWFHLHFVRLEMARQLKADCTEARVVSLNIFDASDLLPRASDIAASELCRRMMTEMISGRVEHVHLVILNANAKEALLTRSVMNCVRCASKYFANLPTTIHIGSRQELLGSLSKHGFSSESLPHSCGGSWQVSCFRRWFEKRLEPRLDEGSLAKNEGLPDASSEKQPESSLLCPESGASPSTLSTMKRTACSDLAAEPAREPLSESVLKPEPRRTPPTAQDLCDVGKQVHDAVAFVRNNLSYMAAVERCPYVVVRESHHARLHAYCGKDPFAAAQRLANYWDLRFEALGEDAFLPTAEALTPADRACLLSGFCCSLPRHPDNRGVYYYDRIRMPSELSVRQRVRALWFHFQFISSHLAAELTGQASNGVIGVVVLRGNDLIPRASDRPATDFGFRVINTASFWKMEHLHFVVVNPTSPVGSLTVTVAALVRYVSAVMADLPSNLHCGTANEVLLSLEKHNFSASSLPNSCGGYWSIETDWPAYVTKSLAILAGGLTSVTPVNTREKDKAPANELGGESSNRGLPAQPQSDRHKLVHEAMSWIPDSQSYLTAMERCLDVVQQESPPSLFLRWSKGNPWLAAQHLATYWSLRARSLGLDAFRSTVDTLTSEDRVSLTNGCRAMLPRTCNGQDVYYYDRTRMRNDMSASQRLRVVWMFAQLMCARHITQHSVEQDRTPLVGIVVFDENDLIPRASDRPASDLMRYLLFETTKAWRAEQMHVVVVCKGDAQSFMSAAIVRILRCVATWFGTTPTSLHHGTTAEVSSSLQKSGFSLDSLPESIGGSWPIESKSALWVEQRLEMFRPVQQNSDEAPECISAPDGDSTPGSNVGTVATSTATASAHGKDSRQSVNRLQSHRTDYGLKFLESDVERQIHCAMARIPSNEAFMTAMQKCPEVVKRESNPSWFHACCERNPSTAAQRLANYWNLRVEALGPSDAFLATSAAITARDQALLSSGYCVTLPKKLQNRTVGLLERSRVPKDLPASQRVRALWFHLQLFCAMLAEENPLGESDGGGIVGMVLVDRDDLNPKASDRATADFALRFIHCATCWRMEHLHVVVLNPTTAIDVLSMAVGSLVCDVSTFLASLPTTLHVGSEGVVWKSLQEHGFAADSLPESCLGCWQRDTAWPAFVEHHLLVSGSAFRDAQFNRVRSNGQARDKHEVAKLAGAATPQGVLGEEDRSLSSEKNVSWSLSSESAMRHNGRQPLDESVVVKGRRSSVLTKLIPSASTSHGWTDGTTQQNPDHAAMEKQVHEAMAWVPDNTAFMMAVEKCPGLVRKESSPVTYLNAFSQGDPWAAASKLALYWKHRVEALGKIDAFRPTAETVSEKDREYMKQGWRAMLPQDRQARDVYYYDRTKTRSDIPTEERLRSLWFHTQMILADFMHKEDPPRQRGLSVIAVLDQNDLLPRKSDKPATDLVRHMLFDVAKCWKMEHLHLVIIDFNDNRSLLSGAVVTLLCCVSSWYGTVPTSLHTGSHAAVLASLQKHGFSACSLPNTVGGALCLETEMNAWIDSRLSLMVMPRERAIPLKTGNQDQQCNQTERLSHRTACNATTLGPPKKGISSPCTAEFQGSVVHEAMAFVPDNAKAAYLRAVKLCPSVVKSESRHDRFMLYSQNNMWDAARRLAAYWDLRENTLGDAAFRPISELSPADENYLKQSYRAILPRTDDQGRAVAYLDRVLFDRSASRSALSKHRKRSTFQFLHMLTMERSTNDEVVVIVRLNNARLSVLRNDKEVADIARRAFTSAMLGKLACIHYVSVDPPMGSGPPPLRTLVHKLGDAVFSWFKGVSIFNHKGTRQQVLESLCQHGLDPSAVPQECGGSWCTDNWMSAARVTAACNYRGNIPASTKTIPVAARSSSSEHRAGEDSDDDREAKVEWFASATHSTSFRARGGRGAKLLPVGDVKPPPGSDLLKTAEQHGLRRTRKQQGAPSHASRKRKSLPADTNQALAAKATSLKDPPGGGSLLRVGGQEESGFRGTNQEQEAKSIGKRDDSEIARNVAYMMEARKLFRRKKNLTYCRRKRARYKANEDSLRHRHQILRQEKERLEAENDRLLGLVAQAKLAVAGSHASRSG